MIFVPIHRGRPAGPPVEILTDFLDDAGNARGRHIVAPGATGLWTGWDPYIAYWVDGAWTRLVLRPGWLAWIATEEALWRVSTIAGLLDRIGEARPRRTG